MTTINFATIARSTKKKKIERETQLLLYPLGILLFLFVLGGLSTLLRFSLVRRIKTYQAQIEQYKKNIKAREAVEEKEFYYTLAVRTTLSLLDKRFNWLSLVNKSLNLTQQSGHCQLISLSLDNNEKERLICGVANLVKVLNLEKELRSTPSLASFKEGSMNGVKRDANGFYNLVLNLEWKKEK